MSLIPTKDYVLYERTAATIPVNISKDTAGNTLTAADVSGLALTGRFGPTRGGAAVKENALAYISGTTFHLTVTANDMATIRDEWYCDVVRDDTGAPVVQLNLEVKPVVLDG